MDTVDTQMTPGSAEAGPSDQATDSDHELSDLRLDIAFGNATFSATGAGHVVLRAFSEFKDHLLAAPATLAPKPPAGERGGDQQTSAAGQNGAASQGGRVEDMPVSVFLSQKTLRGNSQIALGILLWAKRYKGEGELDVEGVKGHWRNSRHKLPANLHRDIATAAKEGWFERLPTGKYSVTSFGERFFDERPDGQQPSR